jgi:hypothetical protein
LAHDINESGQILCEGFHTGPEVFDRETRFCVDPLIGFVYTLLAIVCARQLYCAKRLVYLANGGRDQPTNKQRSEHEVHTTDVHQGRGCWRRLDRADEYPGLRPSQTPQAQRITPTSGARAGRPLVRVVREICAELPLAPGPTPSYH